MAPRADSSSRSAAAITPAVRGEPLAGLETRPGDLAQTAADRLAALTARAAGARAAMIHVAEGDQMRLIGGYALPDHFTRMDAVPAGTTLAGLVVHYGFAVTIEDVARDPRVPPDAPVRAAGIRAYAGFPIRDPDGETVGVCAVMDYRPRHWRAAELTAVDEAAQAGTAFVAELYARRELGRQRSFLGTLLDSLDTGVLACDADGRLVVVNRSLRERLGVDPGDDPPERWVARLPVTRPDGRRFGTDEVPVLRALSGSHVHGVEQVVRTPAGPTRLYSVNAHPIVGPTGQRLGAVSVFHDITERRRAERFRGCELAVTLALNQAQTVGEAAPRVLGAVADTLGWPYAELWLVEPTGDGPTLRRVHCYHDPTRPDDLPAPPRLRPGQGLAGAACDRNEPVWRTDPSGAPSAGLRTSLALPIRSGDRTLGVLTLFTEQQEDPDHAVIALLSGIAAHIGLFIERHRAEELQQALSASKDEYLGLVGHELRTPVTIIASYLELLDAADPATTLAEAQPMTAAIRRGSDRLRRLVDALLDLSTLDSDRARIRRLPVDLTDTVRGAVADARPGADAKHLTLTVDLPARVPVIGDAARLTQLVAALLDNAVRYTPDGGRIEIRLTHPDDRADLLIADTGPGIPEDERPHVFDRFHRGRIATQHAIPGAGLGLSIARLIAEHHHGSITIEPAPVGTRLHVRMPAQPRPA